MTFSYCYTLKNRYVPWASLVAKWVKKKKKSVCQCRRHKFHSWVGKIPWRRKWQPTPVFLPGKAHGQRSLEVCGLWGCKELDTTEQLSICARACTHTHTHTHTQYVPWLREKACHPAHVRTEEIACARIKETTIPVLALLEISQ